MKIGILGAGKFGTVAARLFVAAGHEVAISNSRGPASLRRLAGELGSGAHAMSIADAAAFGEVVLLAVPWHLEEALPPAATLLDKIVIDAMNPYRPEGGFFDLGKSTSSEEVLKRMRGARLVKAFNTISYEHLATRGRKDLPIEERHAVYLAGDSSRAKEVVSKLIEDIGFAPVDTGSLREGGRMQQPESFIYNQTFTAREARAFFRNELHKLIDTLPEAWLLRALETLGRYKVLPPSGSREIRLSEKLEAFRKRAERQFRRHVEDTARRTGRGVIGGYAGSGGTDREGNTSYSFSYMEENTSVKLSVRVFRGFPVEIAERLGYTEDEKRLLLTYNIKGPAGNPIHSRHELELE